VDVLLRTGLYTIGVFIIMLLEKALENLREHEHFQEAFNAVFGSVDINHVLANTLCVIGALLTYNTLTIIREDMGSGGLGRLLASPRTEMESNYPD
jgi:hypothetical protein